MQDSQTIDACVVRAQAGDREAFRDVVERLYPEVAAFVASRCLAVDLMDDVVQGAFISAWEHLAKYEPRGCFAAWVKGHARNLLQRELSARARLVGDDDALTAALARRALERITTDQDPDAEEGRLRLVRRLHRCLEALAPRAQEMARRRFLADVPLAVLAQQFKQSQGAIATALSRIRTQLRACAGHADGSGA